MHQNKLNSATLLPTHEKIDFSTVSLRAHVKRLSPTSATDLWHEPDAKNRKVHSNSKMAFEIVVNFQWLNTNIRYSSINQRFVNAPFTRHPPSLPHVTSWRHTHSAIYGIVIGKQLTQTLIRCEKWFSFSISIQSKLMRTHLWPKIVQYFKSDPIPRQKRRISCKIGQVSNQTSKRQWILHKFP